MLQPYKLTMYSMYFGTLHQYFRLILIRRPLLISNRLRCSSSDSKFECNKIYKEHILWGCWLTQSTNRHFLYEENVNSETITKNQQNETTRKKKKKTIFLFKYEETDRSNRDCFKIKFLYACLFWNCNIKSSRLCMCIHTYKCV